MDAILRQARAAIQQGNLDQADALVTRAEDAHAHYPVWHFGATPSSVRRELAQAVRQNGGKKRPPAIPQNGPQTENRFASGAPSPTAGNEQGGSKNPFEGHSMPLPSFGANNGMAAGSAPVANNLAASNNMPLPSGPSTQPLPPTTSAAGFDDPNSAAYNSADNMPTMGRPLANPFAVTSGGGEAAGMEAIEQASRANSGAIGAAGPANPGKVAPQGTNLAAGENWRLPDAPLPPGAQIDPITAGRGNGLAAPQRSAYQVAGLAGQDARPVGTVQKQQVLSRLQTARQALGEGKLDLAEKLVREASAAGVPESQFLPDEDRPSQLAWDIVRARQEQRAAKPAVATVPAGGQRYAQPTGQMPAVNANGVIQAAGTEPVPPIDSDERWAMVPEPLSLPSDPTAPADASAPLPQSAAQLRPQGPPVQPTNQAADLLDAGEAALRMHDRKSAVELLNQAHVMREQLDPSDRDRLQEHLHMLAAEPVDRQIPAATAPPVAREAQLSAPPRVNSLLDQSFPSEGSPFVSDDPSLENPGTQAEAFPPSNNSPLRSSGIPSATAAQPEEFEIPPDASDAPSARPVKNPSLMNSATQSDRVLARQIRAEVGKRQSEAKRLLEKDPDRAKEILLRSSEAGERLEALGRVSPRAVEPHRNHARRRPKSTSRTTSAEIELDEQNQAVLDAVDRDREVKVKVQQKNGRAGRRVQHGSATSSATPRWKSSPAG